MNMNGWCWPKKGCAKLNSILFAPNWKASNHAFGFGSGFNLCHYCDNYSNPRDFVSFFILWFYVLCTFCLWKKEVITYSSSKFIEDYKSMLPFDQIVTQWYPYYVHSSFTQHVLKGLILVKSQHHRIFFFVFCELIICL